MALPLKEWLKTVQPMNKIPIEELQTKTFMRDPFRSRYIDDRYFLSPADGIILYAQEMNPTEQLAEIKGVQYTLKDIMEDQTFDKTCLVIGIFMTFFDVHINRIPYAGTFDWKLLPPIMSYNKPMVAEENDILTDLTKKIYGDLSYMKHNARMLNTIYNPWLDYTYFVTQIADDEVNVISHFTTHKYDWFDQGQRFSFVRWGSQCELIMPIDDRFTFKTLIQKEWHVESGQDKLVEVIK
jgi:phosphatidylserine decarboxylase